MPNELQSDTGCDLWQDCLTCPLPQCRYDLLAKQAVSMALAVRAFYLRMLGYSVQQCAAELRCSRRTLFRYLSWIDGRPEWRRAIETLLADPETLRRLQLLTVRRSGAAPDSNADTEMPEAHDGSDGVSDEPCVDRDREDDADYAR